MILPAIKPAMHTQVEMSIRPVVIPHDVRWLQQWLGVRRALYNCLDHVFSSKKAGRVLVPVHKSNTILIDWLNAAGFTLAQNILSKPGYVLYLLGKPADR